MELESPPPEDFATLLDALALGSANDPAAPGGKPA
jgi:hypothetical protein